MTIHNLKLNSFFAVYSWVTNQCFTLFPFQNYRNHDYLTYKLPEQVSPESRWPTIHTPSNFPPITQNWIRQSQPLLKRDITKAQHPLFVAFGSANELLLTFSTGWTQKSSTSFLKDLSLRFVLSHLNISNRCHSERNAKEGVSNGTRRTNTCSFFSR